MVPEYCPRICAELERPGFSGIDPEIPIDPEPIGERSDSMDVANLSYSRPPEERNPCGVELPGIAPEVATLPPKRPYFGTRHPYLHHAPNDPEHEEEEEEDEDEEEEEEEEEEEHKEEDAGDRKQSVLDRIRTFFLG